MMEVQLKKAALMGAASAIALFGVIGAHAQDVQETPDQPEEAQDENADQGDVITVTGIRQNLNRAVQEKRNAAQVLDSVPLGDVGDLPTISIADSLEFLPGVVGTRFRGNVDQIAIRGLPQLFTGATVDGRELTSGNGNRFVRYRIFPAQFFTGAQVQKSPLPDQVEGGIAGSINLSTPSPIDYRGRKLNLDLRVQNSPFNENNDKVDETGYQGTARYTTKWDLQSGEAGLTLGLDYMDNPIAVGQAFMPAHSERTILGQNVVTPNNAQFMNDTEEFERLSGLAVFEMERASGARLKLDAIVTNAENPQLRTRLQVNNLNTPNRYVSIETEGGALLSGEMQNLLILSNFEKLEREDDAYLLGANFERPIGNWTVEADAYMSQTDVDFLLTRPSFRTLGVDANFEYGKELVSFTDFSTDLNDQSVWGANQMFANKQERMDRTRGLRLDFTRELSSFFTSVKAGGRWSQRTVETTQVNFVDNDVRNAGLYPELAIGALDPSLFAEPYIEYDLRDETAGAFPSPFVVFDIDAVLDAMPQPDFTPQNADKLNRFVDNEEDTWAAYLRADFATSLANMPLSGVIGGRLVNTTLTAKGFSGTPVPVEDEDTNSIQIEVPGDLTEVEEKNENTIFLPSLNLMLEPTETTAIRFAVARTMARANFRDLRLAQNLRGGFIENQPFFGDAGNPNLEPIKADQVDLTFEWYPNESSAFSTTAYYKDVSGFITNDVRTTQIGEYAYELTSPVNADDGAFYGLEFFARHDLDWLPQPLDGFGFVATASFNDTDIEVDYTLLNAVDEDGNFLYDAEDRNPGVEGLAKTTASAVLFYEKGPVSLKTSARYAGDRIRQVRSNNTPWVSTARTLYDLSASYRVSPEVRLQFQVNNITEEPNSAYYVFDNYTSWNQQSGRTYYLGANFRF